MGNLRGRRVYILLYLIAVDVCNDLFAQIFQVAIRVLKIKRFQAFQHSHLIVKEISKLVLSQLFSGLCQTISKVTKL